MKKDIGTAVAAAAKEKAKRSGRAKVDAGGPSVAGFRLPEMPEALRKLLGTKPMIRYSHQAALKLFENLGWRFEVRHLGESRLGLLRWPLRKMGPGAIPRRLVMVPGFGDTPLSWWSVLAGLKPVLKREVDEVILIDYPGYCGFLHDEPAFDSMDELMRVFREIVASLKPEVLVGHSLGAWLAADFAIERPETVRKLYLVDPGGLVTTEEDRANYRGLFANAIESGPDHLLPHVFAKAPVWLPFFQTEFFSFLKTPEVRAFIASFDDRHLLNDRVQKIRAETTILWGDRDTLTPVKWIEQWLERLPADRKKQGILIRGSGHSPQLEKPGVVIALFTQLFLGKEPKNLSFLPLWKVV